MPFYNYIVQNKLNGKRYVGYAADVEKRWKNEEYFGYWGKFNGYNQPFYRAIRRDGWANFSKKIVGVWETEDEAKEYEKWLIAYYYTNRNRYGNKYGYNLTDGGDGVSGRSHTEEWKEEQSKMMKEIWAERLKNGYVSPLIGRTHTEESKKLMSESAMGKLGTNTGKIFDEEWVLKISKSNAGRESKNTRRFSDEIEQEICELYIDKELSFYKLGQQYNCARSLIIEIIDRNNIPHRQNSYTGHNNGRNLFTKEQELEICQIYQNGKTTRRALSKQFNCGNTTIRDILLRNGVKL